jgi:uncharacterized 2Fe-2S/4Fe-4S cluster protein (DUF4445 family)
MPIVTAYDKFEFDLAPAITGVPRALGIAMDIGTTTIAAELVSLENGARLAKRSILNPQTAYAGDVLSRIHIASEPAGLAKLHEAFVDAFKELRDGLLSDAKASARDIHAVVYSGNATMLHIAANVDPSSMGSHPYTPTLQGDAYLPADNLGLAEGARVYFPPYASAFIGADITSGILAAGLDKLHGTTLFIDVGTNGEIVLARDGKMAAAATAAGPAFEGMNIECGMRASAGAIARFMIDGSGAAHYETIGGADAAGICGSGLLDIVAELARTGGIDNTGRLCTNEQLSMKNEKLMVGNGNSQQQTKANNSSLYITDAVYLTQNDIRQVQLAKGAIRAGCDALMDTLGVAAAQVDRVLIAGSFGYHLRETSLLDLGMLPWEFAGKLRFVGNTSLSGAAAFLLNKKLRGQMNRAVGNIKVVDLNDTADFEGRFVGALGFTHNE